MEKFKRIFLSIVEFSVVLVLAINCIFPALMNAPVWISKLDYLLLLLLCIFDLIGVVIRNIPEKKKQDTDACKAPEEVEPVADDINVAGKTEEESKSE